MFIVFAVIMIYLTDDNIIIGYFLERVIYLLLMDKYFLAIIGVIIFTVLIVLYVRISGKTSSASGKSSESSDNLKEGADFTILE